MAVSIIVPTYNIDKYINRCLNSISEQTYSDIEVIIVDDGSTDGTGEICKKFVEKDSRFKYFYKQNGGLSSARNFGLDRTRGDYIAFVDGDDFVEKDMIETLFKNATLTGADIIACGFSEENRGDEVLSLKEGIYSGQEILKKMAEPLGYKYVVAWNKLYKKEVFDEVRFKLNKKHEDQWIVHKLLLKANKVSCIDNVLYRHDNRQGSITSEKDIIAHFDDIDALLYRAKLLDEQGLDYLNKYTEMQLFDLVKHYLSDSFNSKRYTLKEIKLIESKLSECLAFFVSCAHKFELDKKKIKTRKRLYKLSLIEKLKLTK